MNIPKDIPAQIGVNNVVNLITFNLDLKKAYVHVFNTATGFEKVYEVDVMQLFIDRATTTTQKTTIKAFFKYIIAKAVDVADGVVPDEIFIEV